jgi:hypothetical protein
MSVGALVIGRNGLAGGPGDIPIPYTPKGADAVPTLIRCLCGGNSHPSIAYPRRFLLTPYATATSRRSGSGSIAKRWSLSICKFLLDILVSLAVVLPTGTTSHQGAPFLPRCALLVCRAITSAHRLSRCPRPGT